MKVKIQITDDMGKLYKGEIILKEESEDSGHVDSAKADNQSVLPSTTLLKISKKSDLAPERIKEFFDVEEDKITLLRHNEQTTELQQQEIALLTLLGYKCFFGIEEVLSTEIKRNIQEQNISANNLSASLKSLMPQFIRRKGEPKSPSLKYRLQSRGEALAIEKLIKMDGNEK